jgi:hypothetical protein
MEHFGVKPSGTLVSKLQALRCQTFRYFGVTPSGTLVSNLQALWCQTFRLFGVKSSDTLVSNLQALRRQTFRHVGVKHSEFITYKLAVFITEGKVNQSEIIIVIKKNCKRSVNYEERNKWSTSHTPKDSPCEERSWK